MKLKELKVKPKIPPAKFPVFRDFREALARLKDLRERPTTLPLESKKNNF